LVEVRAANAPVFGLKQTLSISICYKAEQTIRSFVYPFGFLGTREDVSVALLWKVPPLEYWLIWPLLITSVPSLSRSL